MRILCIVRLTVLFSDRDSILCHIRIDLICTSHFAGIKGSGVSNRNLFSILHLFESIIKAFPGNRICCITAGISGYLHIVVKPQRSSGNHILNIDVFGISGSFDLNRIMISSCSFIKCSTLRRIGIRMIVIINNDFLLYGIAEPDRSLRSVKTSIKLRTKRYIICICQTREFRVTFIEFDREFSISCDIQCRISLIGYPATGHYDLQLLRLVIRYIHACRHIVGKRGMVCKLPLSSFFKSKSNAIGFIRLYHIGASLRSGTGDNCICKEVYQLRTLRPLISCGIRHIDNKCHAVIHFDGQSLFARKRRKRCEQPVSICLLLYFDQIIVGECYIAHIADRKRLVEISLVKAKNLCQLAQINAASALDAISKSIVSEVNRVHNAIYGEGLRVKSDLADFIAAVGIGFDHLSVRRAILKVHSLNFAFGCYFERFVISNIYANLALRLDLLLLTVCTGRHDRDVKKARFRHALTCCRFCACKVGLVFGSSLLDLADFEFRRRGDLRILIISQRHIVIRAVIDQLTGGENFFLRLRCCRCRFFRSQFRCRCICVFRCFRIFCCCRFFRYCRILIFRFNSFLFRSSLRNLFFRCCIFFLRSFRACFLNSLCVCFLPFACLFLCLNFFSAFFIGRLGRFRVSGTFHLFLVYSFLGDFFSTGNAVSIRYLCCVGDPI